MFNKIVDSLQYTNKKSEKATWKRLLGDCAIKEFFEREKISIKHQTIVFKLIGFMVENQRNFFISSKKNENFVQIVKKLITFYKSFFFYFKFGNKSLIRQISTEMTRNNNQLKAAKQIEDKEANRLKLKEHLFNEQSEIDEMIAKLCLYRLMIKAYIQLNDKDSGKSPSMILDR